jgi:hypothetical protein
VNEPGSFGLNAGFLTCVGAPSPTIVPFATAATPAATAMFTSMPPGSV